MHLQDTICHYRKINTNLKRNLQTTRKSKEPQAFDNYFRRGRSSHFETRHIQEEISMFLTDLCTYKKVKLHDGIKKYKIYIHMQVESVRHTIIPHP